MTIAIIAALVFVCGYGIWRALPGLKFAQMVLGNPWWEVESNGSRGTLFLEVPQDQRAFPSNEFLSCLGIGRTFNIAVGRVKSKRFYTKEESKKGPALVITKAVCHPETFCKVTAGLGGNPANPAVLTFQSLSPGVGTVQVTAEASWGRTFEETVQIVIEEEPDTIVLEPEVSDQGNIQIGMNQERTFELFALANGRRTPFWVTVILRNESSRNSSFSLSVNRSATPRTFTDVMTEHKSIRLEARRPGVDVLELRCRKLSRLINIVAVPKLAPPKPPLEK